MNMRESYKCPYCGGGYDEIDDIIETYIDVEHRAYGELCACSCGESYQINWLIIPESAQIHK